MKKSAILSGLLVFAGIVLVAATIFAAETASKGSGRAYEAREIIGTPIKNAQGEYLGRITDLIVDTNGRVDFALIGQPGIFGFHGKLIAVPFQALTYDAKARHLVLNVSKKALDEAPAFARKMIADRRQSEEIYKYFGQQPYWTDEGTGKSVRGKSMIKKGARDLQDLPENYY
jgi:sporulation protein YlmC with PRC-barrel domain